MRVRPTKIGDLPMRDSWLVQRLLAPHSGPKILGADNPFAFGGGLRNGGLSDDAMDLLRPVFSFDYMGSAEFEFGAVPEALGRLAKTKVMVVSEMIIDLSTVEMPYRMKGDLTPDRTGHKMVYSMHPEAWTVEVTSRILRWATDPYHKDAQTKERVGLNDTLLPVNEYAGRVQGWLELDNGFFFFTDKTMCARTANIFGIEHPFGEFILTGGDEDG